MTREPKANRTQMARINGRLAQLLSAGSQFPSSMTDSGDRLASTSANASAVTVEVRAVKCAETIRWKTKAEH